VDEIYYVCFSNSGKLLATCGADGSVKVMKICRFFELKENTRIQKSLIYFDFPYRCGNMAITQNFYSPDKS
jgi:WD40 repeat protein